MIFKSSKPISYKVALPYDKAKPTLLNMMALAGPATLSRLGFILITTVDIAMLGQYSTKAIASYSLAHAIAIMLVVAMIGGMMGVMILTSRSLGEGKPEKCGQIYRISLIIALLFGCTGFVVGLLFLPFVGLSASDPDVAENAQYVYFIMLFGIPASALMAGSTFFLEGLKRPLQVTAVLVVFNVLNLFANDWAIPLWGSLGAAGTSTALRWLLGLLLVGIIFLQPDRKQLGLLDKVTEPFWKASKALIWQGKWVALSYFIESAALAVIFVVLAILPVQQYALLGIGHNLITFLSVAFIGVAVATSITSSYAVGQRRVRYTKASGLLGVVICIMINLLSASLMFYFAEEIAHIYSNDPEIIRQFTDFVPWLSAAVLGWSSQILMAQALRGIGYSHLPTWINGFFYIIILLPLSLILSLTFEHGPRGVFEAEAIASLGAFFYMFLVWRKKIQRPSTYAVS